MKKNYSVVTSKGQVTIPYYIRNKLRLSSGSKIEFIMKDDAIVVVPINRSIKNLQGILPKPKFSLSVEEMNETIKGSYDRD